MITGAPWVAEARKYIGLSEIPGIKHESKILSFWRAIKLGGIKDDETPWCAAFVGAMLEVVGVKSTQSGWAKSYLNWGVPIQIPAYGCIVVFDRAGGGGHVGFAIGYDTKGRILILGGNQGNKVSVAPFETARILALRWSTDCTVPSLPLSNFHNDAPSSTNEA